MEHGVVKEWLTSILEAVGEQWSDSLNVYNVEMWRDACEAVPSNQTEERTPGGDADPLLCEARCAALEAAVENLPKDRWGGRDWDFFATVAKAVFIFSGRGMHSEVQVLLRFMDHVDGIDFTELFYDPTPLHMAVQKGDAKMVEILMSSRSTNCANFHMLEKHSPLVWAWMTEELDCLRAMVRHGADTRMDGEEGRLQFAWMDGEEERPLMMVVVEEQRRLDLLELLLEEGVDHKLLSSERRSMESVLRDIIYFSLDQSEEELQESLEFVMKAVHLLLRYGFTPNSGLRNSLLDLVQTEFHRLLPLAALLFERDEPFDRSFAPNSGLGNSLLDLVLTEFQRLLPLAALLFERDEPFDRRVEQLEKSLCTALKGRSEAEAYGLLDKANAVLDLAMVKPPRLRFALRQREEAAGADRDHQGALWAVDWLVPSLQALCRAVVRCSLLPCPLEPKIKALPLPKPIKDQLMPLNKDWSKDWSKD